MSLYYHKLTIIILIKSAFDVLLIQEIFENPTFLCERRKSRIMPVFCQKVMKFENMHMTIDNLWNLEKNMCTNLAVTSIKWNIHILIPLIPAADWNKVLGNFINFMAFIILAH